MAASPRILLCGDVLGRLNQLFKRVQSVNKSTGPFDALLCVGQFFPDSADCLDELTNYIHGGSAIPIPTFFIGDYGFGAAPFLSAAAKRTSNKGFKMDGLEICPNLYWLKGSGKFSLQGLSVFYLSGRQVPDVEGNGRYTRDDVDALRALAEEPGVVDIFMTNEWPHGVWNRSDLSELAPAVSDPSGSDPVVAELAAEIKPRYHIAGTKAVFYAREPYFNDGAVHVSRFLGLATVGNKDKLINTGGMMFQKRGQGKMEPVGKDCASNIHPLELVPKGKSVVIDTMKMPGSNILKMYVLIFSTKENVNVVQIVDLDIVWLRKETLSPKEGKDLKMENLIGESQRRSVGSACRALTPRSILC